MGKAEAVTEGAKVQMRRSRVQKCKGGCRRFGWRVVGRRRAAEGGGVASPRPLEKECTIERAPTWVRPAANDDLGIAGTERVGMVRVC